VASSPRQVWRGCRTLVTGATGFIGSHLARRLGELGAEVHAVSRRPVDDRSANHSWHVVDLRDAGTTAELVRSVHPDVVFHLASEVTGLRDLRLVLPTLDGNLVGAVNLLTAVTDNAPSTPVVLAGSVEEPARGRGDAPSSPYAVAKWAATGYARMFHRLWGVPVTVLRVAMVYGPGQPDTTKLVPYVTLSLLQGQEPRLASGTRLVDWVYVDDVVAAFIVAAETGHAVGRVVDIGSGEEVSIRDTVELLASIVGTSRPLRFGALPDRPLDVARIADTGPAAEMLRWHPTVGLAEGLHRTVQWYANHAPEGAA
jgi:UDP-glucose 4-epimerase